MDESDTEKIALNEDFGSALLDCLDDNRIEERRPEAMEGVEEEIPILHENSIDSSDWDRGVSQDDLKLPAFSMGFNEVPGSGQQEMGSNASEFGGSINYLSAPGAAAAPVNLPQNDIDVSRQGIRSNTNSHQGDLASSFLQQYLPLAINAFSAGVDLSSLLSSEQLRLLGGHTGNSSIASHSESEEEKRDESGPADSNQPTFLLFDAPLELRTSFLQAQRAHGIVNDSQEYSSSFGVPVRGFHPQAPEDSEPPPAEAVKMVDARREGPGGKRLKNVKEQKRAKRITSLIDELRHKMEKDGWSVGVRSKIHTLSSCADYVKHLIAANNKKEHAIEKARCDLEAAKKKLEDKKANLERSDPESTTSSLTISSGSASKNRTGQVSKDSSDTSTSQRVGKSGTKISSDQVSSGVSDVTDSNKSSSIPSGGSSSRPGLGSTSLSSEALETKGADKTSSSDSDSNARKDRKRKRRAEDFTSLDDGFELDYEEVFMTSNVPQLLATTSGRIVNWNELCEKATGLTDENLPALTIFSFVKRHRLSDLYELVASILRDSEVEGVENNARSRKKTLTLPCVSFPDSALPKSHSLNMTVTLLNSPDTRQHCLHCVFTDCAASESELGSISPELLALLFAKGAAKKSSAKKRRRDVPQSISRVNPNM